MQYTKSSKIFIFIVLIPLFIALFYGINYFNQQQQQNKEKQKKQKRYKQYTLQIKELLWQNQPYSKTDIEHFYAHTQGGKVWSYNGAVRYCSELRLNAYSQWRLPTQEELKTLLTQEKNAYYIDKRFLKHMPDINPSYHFVSFWSSTQKGIKESLSVDFRNGKEDTNLRSNLLFVRCVK